MLHSLFFGRNLALLYAWRLQYRESSCCIFGWMMHGGYLVGTEEPCVVSALSIHGMVTGITEVVMMCMSR